MTRKCSVIILTYKDIYISLRYYALESRILKGDFHPKTNQNLAGSEQYREYHINKGNHEHRHRDRGPDLPLYGFSRDSREGNCSAPEPGRLLLAWLDRCGECFLWGQGIAYGRKHSIIPARTAGGMKRKVAAINTHIIEYFLVVLFEILKNAGCH